MARWRAIVSVSEKRGLLEFARALAELDVEILSTGGTAASLRDAGVPVTAISQYTGAPEILDGRVKTLHPRIHGGILATASPQHAAQLKEHDIGLIDLVIVNLYPFRETIARPNVSFDEAIENIDIGGPTMLRAAAKNHARVTVVVDPNDYAIVLSELASGGVGDATRLNLARKVFAHTAAYDAAVASYLADAQTPDELPLPRLVGAQLTQTRPLRYGENPHQSAALYRVAASTLPGWGTEHGVAGAEVLQGKELSYNNLLDLDAAWQCCADFAAPTVVVVKHTNPCGVASATSPSDALRLALETDPTSAFGGIIASNREVDLGFVEALGELFLECLIAPAFSDAALAKLSARKNLRVVRLRDAQVFPRWNARSISGGILVQQADADDFSITRAKQVSKRAPSESELRGLDFAWRVAKHVKSNAIVFCGEQRTLAIGAGQMSRVDSTVVATHKARFDLKGSAAASDAFFPFRDGLDQIAAAGATCVIQPGGSVRDAEVIAAADDHNLAMLFTGTRHFRH